MKPTIVRKDGKVLVQGAEHWWLRYSRGPKQGHFWDMYGEDYINEEWANLAISQAPPVPEGKPFVEFSLSLDT